MYQRRQLRYEGTNSHPDGALPSPGPSFRHVLYAVLASGREATATVGLDVQGLTYLNVPAGDHDEINFGPEGLPLTEDQGLNLTPSNNEKLDVTVLYKTVPAGSA